MAKWLIDNFIKKEPYNESLDVVLDRLGIEYHAMDYVPFIKDNDTPMDDSENVVLYGSVQFCRHYSQDKGFVPGIYYSPSVFLCSQYMTHYPQEWFLNSPSVFVPFGIFKSNKDWFYSIFNTKNLFIRPDSGFKTFSGLVIHQDEFDYEIGTLDFLSSAVNQTMIMVGDAYDIREEYRYFIVDKKVISHSRYKLGDELSISEDNNEVCQELANKVSQHDYQLDIAYVCDIGYLSNGEAKIIEFNSISSSGFYKADIEKVVKAIDIAANMEYTGELTL